MTKRYIETFWKPAEEKHLTLALQGRIVEARFRDSDEYEWKYNVLTGFVCRDSILWMTRSGAYKQCQVYDPPEYWMNQPTPNVGFRLLDKFPHEDIAIGDEKWDPNLKKWFVVKAPSSNKQPEEIWFSRRIEVTPTQCVGHVCVLAQSTGVTCPHDSCDRAMGVRESNNPGSQDSSNSSNNPNGCGKQSSMYQALEGEVIELPNLKKIRVLSNGIEVL